MHLESERCYVSSRSMIPTAYIALFTQRAIVMSLHEAQRVRRDQGL